RLPRTSQTSSIIRTSAPETTDRVVNLPLVRQAEAVGSAEILETAGLATAEPAARPEAMPARVRGAAVGAARAGREITTAARTAVPEETRAAMAAVAPTVEAGTREAGTATVASTAAAVLAAGPGGVGGAGGG